MANSKIWDAYDKNYWFYERAKLSYFTFKNGQETGTKFIALWRQFVSSGFFTPCFWGEIQKLRKCQVVLNRIVSQAKQYRPPFLSLFFLSATHKLTSRVDVTWPFGRVIQMPFLKVK